MKLRRLLTKHNKIKEKLVSGWMNIDDKSMEFSRILKLSRVLIRSRLSCLINRNQVADQCLMQVI